MKSKRLILLTIFFICLTICRAQAVTGKQISGTWRIQQVDGKDSLSSVNSAMSLFFLNQHFYECKFSGNSVTLLDKDGNTIDKTTFTIEQKPDESYTQIHISDEDGAATWLLKDDVLEIHNEDLTITLKKL